MKLQLERGTGKRKGKKTHTFGHFNGSPAALVYCSHMKAFKYFAWEIEVGFFSIVKN